MQVDSSADAAAAAPNPSHATGPLVELSVPLDGAAAWMSPETASATPNPIACVCRRCIQFLSPVTRMPTTHFSDLSQVAAGAAIWRRYLYEIGPVAGFGAPHTDRA